jgi:hypothetical protein
LDKSKYDDAIRRHAIDYDRALFLTHEEYWIEADGGAVRAHRATHP